MNRFVERVQAKYWAYGITSDLLDEYIKHGTYKELYTVFGTTAYGKQQVRFIVEQLKVLAEYHDKRRNYRPRAASRVKSKRVYSGKRTGETKAALRIVK